MEKVKHALKLALKYAPPLNYEKLYPAIREALAELEQSTPVEPAQAVPVDDEGAFQDYVSRCKTLWAGLDWDKQVVEFAREAYLAGRKNPASSAIDDKTCKPLTDEQIKQGMKEADPAGEDLCRWSFAAGVEFAEKAHGIGGE